MKEDKLQLLSHGFQKKKKTREYDNYSQQTWQSKRKV